MRTYAPEVGDLLSAGIIDFFDAVTFYFDSGPVSLFIGGVGKFTWEGVTYYGAGQLLSIERSPENQGAASEAVTLRLRETWVPPNTDQPVNIFDDGIRQTIDDEDWRWRVAVLSIFWRNQDGVILEREQWDVRLIDDMPAEADENGLPIRVAVLERPEIIQRDIEGKTSNAEFQRQIDATDRGMEHTATVVTQKINFGRRPEGTVA